MVKTTTRMFATSSAAAASAASRLKLNLSTVTRLPMALKRSSPTQRMHVDKEISCKDEGLTDRLVPLVSRTEVIGKHKEEEEEEEEKDNEEEEEDEEDEAAKVVPTLRMFQMPSLRSIRTVVSKDKTACTAVLDCPVKSSEVPMKRSTSSSSTHENSEDEVERNEEPEVLKAAVNSASRFVMGMPTLLRRAVSSNCPLDVSMGIPTKPMDTSVASITDEGLENDRHSLLLMLQVPQTRRQSQVPLMAASETW